MFRQAISGIWRQLLWPICCWSNGGSQYNEDVDGNVVAGGGRHYIQCLNGDLEAATIADVYTKH